MKNFAKSKGKRITAALLCAVMCIMSLPLSAFAFTAEEGKTVDAYYGDRYFGSDGDYYYSPESHQYIAYDENGNTSLHSASGVHRRTKLMIKDSSGSRQIMCIESGIDYNAGGTYSSVNGKNSSYFQNLPTTAQYGIMLTSVYGWRPGTTAPISGTNEDDFSMATQTILWEYQQQLRTSPTTYQQNDYTGTVPTLQDFRAELLKQDEPEAKEIALAIELFTHGSLNTFAKQTNVDTNNRLICYDILDLGKQLMPIGMLVVLDSILNRITQNRAKGKNTYIFIDEIYLLFQHEYSANFLFTLWKRVRKYGAYATGITQNVDDLLQSHTARTMLANSEFIIMLNQASTDRLKLAELLNISDLQMSYITNVEAGHGLLKVGSSLVPFANKFPKNTKLYKLMTTKPGESA